MVMLLIFMLLLYSLESVPFCELMIFSPDIVTISSGKITIFIGAISCVIIAVVSSDALRGRICCHTLEDSLTNNSFNHFCLTWKWSHSEVMLQGTPRSCCYQWDTNPHPSDPRLWSPEITLFSWGSVLGHALLGHTKGGGISFSLWVLIQGRRQRISWLFVTAGPAPSGAQWDGFCPIWKPREGFGEAFPCTAARHPAELTDTCANATSRLLSPALISPCTGFQNKVLCEDLGFCSCNEPYLMKVTAIKIITTTVAC